MQAELTSDRGMTVAQTRLSKPGMSCLLVPACSEPTERGARGARHGHVMTRDGSDFVVPDMRADEAARLTSRVRGASLAADQHAGSVIDRDAPLRHIAAVSDQHELDDRPQIGVFQARAGRLVELRNVQLQVLVQVARADELLPRR